MSYSDCFDQALTLATIVHAGVCRKGTEIPYIMHPVHVARLLDRHGFEENVVLAGLLHDVLEDAEFGKPRLQKRLRSVFNEFKKTESSEAAFRVATEALIAARLGADVLELVQAVTEVKSDGTAKRPWRDRKNEQLAHIPKMGQGAAALKAADALHNVQSILRDVRRSGLGTLRRFNCTVDDTLWYYTAVAEGLRQCLPEHPLVAELHVAAEKLNEEIALQRSPVEAGQTFD